VSNTTIRSTHRRVLVEPDTLPEVHMLAGLIYLCPHNSPIGQRRDLLQPSLHHVQRSRRSHKGSCSKGRYRGTHRPRHHQTLVCRWRRSKEVETKQSFPEVPPPAGTHCFLEQVKVLWFNVSQCSRSRVPKRMTRTTSRSATRSTRPTRTNKSRRVEMICFHHR
jgi:hypothetical protein